MCPKYCWAGAALAAAAHLQPVHGGEVGVVRDEKGATQGLQLGEGVLLQLLQARVVEDEIPGHGHNVAEHAAERKVDLLWNSGVAVGWGLRFEGLGCAQQAKKAKNNGAFHPLGASVLDTCRHEELQAPRD